MSTATKAQINAAVPYLLEAENRAGALVQRLSFFRQKIGDLRQLYIDFSAATEGTDEYNALALQIKGITTSLMRYVEGDPNLDGDHEKDLATLLGELNAQYTAFNDPANGELSTSLREIITEEPPPTP